jgi:hypothetical protein
LLGESFLDVSRAIPETGHTFVRGAIGTAEDRLVLLDTMPDYLASAMSARWR